MKKLLLLSALFIFACSSEDNTNSQNPEQNTKLLKTYTTVDGYCHEGVNVEFYYDFEGKLISTTETLFLSDCPPNNWNEWTYQEPYNKYYNYSNNGIQITSNSVNDLLESSFILNADGTAVSVTSDYGTSNLIFSDGLLLEINDDDDGLQNFNWVNNNLIEVISSYQGTTIDEKFTYEYTDYINKTAIFPVNFNFITFGEDISYQILGVLGNNSNNLPSKNEYISYTSFGLPSIKKVRTYAYIFDQDGYPTRITEIEVSYDYDDQLEDWVEDDTRQTIVELTYYE